MSGCHDGGFGVGGGFAFIVVLFILLIIVGASFVGSFGGCGPVRSCSSIRIWWILLRKFFNCRP